MRKYLIFGSKRRDDVYVKKNIWRKVKKTASKVPFILKAVTLYFCALDRNTPTAAKVKALSALAYFILPLDFIPDIIPLGYSDDAAVIMIAIKSLNPYITDEHKRKAKQWLMEENIAINN